MDNENAAPAEPAADDARPEPPTVAAGENPIAHADPPHPLHLLVDAWWQEAFRGSPLGHHTQLYAHVWHAVQDLKRRLTDKSGAE
jgi:hypothetical protein